jgi:hypothetical protein
MVHPHCFLYLMLDRVLQPAEFIIYNGTIVVGLTHRVAPLRTSVAVVSCRVFLAE